MSTLKPHTMPLAMRLKTSISAEVVFDGGKKKRKIIFIYGKK